MTRVRPARRDVPGRAQGVPRGVVQGPSRQDNFQLQISRRRKQMGRRVRRGARHVGELGMDFEPGPLRLVPVVLICFLCVRVCVETFLLGLMWFLCEYMKITLLLIAAGVPFITYMHITFTHHSSFTTYCLPLITFYLSLSTSHHSSFTMYCLPLITFCLSLDTYRWLPFT